jgi:Ca2+-binding RTX toxin-like protein
MVGGAGNDTYAIDNAGDSVSEAFNEGVDTVITSLSHTLGANVENLTLYLDAVINGTGNELANVITGSTGANVINGGLGSDILRGGLGDDTFVFDTALTSVDVIADYAAGDHIALDNDVFTALGLAGNLDVGLFHSGAGLTASTAAAEGAGVYYNTTTGGLYYDADGFGGSASVQFATVTGHPVLGSTAFLVQD